MSEDIASKIVSSEIRKTKEDYSISYRGLETPSGTPFRLQETTGFVPDAQQIANKGPVLIKGKVEIKDPYGPFVSKDRIWIIVAHGFRLGDVHNIRTENGSMPSSEVVQAIVADREQRGVERVRLFVSCDDVGNISRWDEGELAGRLGIIGFAGDKNAMTPRASDEVYVIKTEGLRSPFENDNHPNRWLTNPRYSPFVRKELTLTEADFKKR